MTRLPGAIFIVDTTREHIAVKEAQKLKIPIFAMVDTNSDPRDVDYVIPSNDDASKSIDKILDLVTSAVAEGLSERKSEKEATEANDANKMEAAAKSDEAKAKVEAVEEKKQETSKDDQQNEKASSKQAPSDKEVKKEKDA
jgi:small subunit ribosomal protein S2